MAEIDLKITKIIKIHFAKVFVYLIRFGYCSFSDNSVKR